ncbi:MAG: NUDIX hydrolase [Candidatus Levybacteria bacterium]|nr:NUDIX hydrolase [Candidatus Levybacteria bacterium]
MKILSKKTLYSSKYFRVIEKSFERNGKTFTKDIIERNPIVAVIPYTTNNDIYMESQFRDALGGLSLEIVAGHIEKGDEPLETAKKELKEESGLVATTWHKIAYWDISVNMQAKVHVYAATGLSQEDTALENDEEIEMVKMPLDKVIEKIENGEMTAGYHIAALFLFKKLREEGKL